MEKKDDKTAADEFLRNLQAAPLVEGVTESNTKPLFASPEDSVKLVADDIMLFCKEPEAFRTHLISTHPMATIAQLSMLSVYVQIKKEGLETMKEKIMAGPLGKYFDKDKL